jgi:hypothetical protein
MAQPGTFLRAVVCFPDGTGGGVGVAWVDCKYPADANNCVPVVQRQRLCFGGLSYSPGMVWEGYVRLCMHLCVCALEIWCGFNGDQEIIPFEKLLRLPARISGLRTSLRTEF